MGYKDSIRWMSKSNTMYTSTCLWSTYRIPTFGFFYAEWPLFTVMIKVQSLIIYWMDEYNVYQRLFVLNGTHTAMAGYNMYIYKCRKSKNVANLLEHMAIDKLMSMRPDDPTCGLDKGIYLVHACRQISGPVMVIWVIGSLVKWPVSQGYQSIVFQNHI